MIGHDLAGHGDEQDVELVPGLSHEKIVVEFAARDRQGAIRLELDHLAQIVACRGRQHEARQKRVPARQADEAAVRPDPVRGDESAHHTDELLLARLGLVGGRKGGDRPVLKRHRRQALYEVGDPDVALADRDAEPVEEVEPGRLAEEAERIGRQRRRHEISAGAIWSIQRCT